MSSTWASVVPAGTVPKDTTPATSTVSLPVLARRVLADPHEIGRFEGIGPDLWKWGAASTMASVGREPVTAEDCGSECGGDASRSALSATGFDSSSHPPQTGFGATSTFRVPRRSARARASVRRWLWSLRRGRSGEDRLLYALNWTRLSCHRFVANRVRLSLFILAYNLGNFLRRLCLPKAIRHWSLRSVQVKLIKMGGRLVRHSRRLIFQLSEVSVPRWLFQGVLDRIGRLSPAPS